MLGSSTKQVTGIVLAGGHSRRLGRDKAVEEIGGIRIIDRVIETLNNCCENILVIGDRPERRSELSLPGNVMFEHDTNIGKGSLGGLYTGLRASKTQWTLAVACDMPFLCYELIEELKNYGRQDILIILGGVIPKQDYKSLLKTGVSAIFGPGSQISKTAIEILNLLIKKL